MTETERYAHVRKRGKKKALLLCSSPDVHSHTSIQNRQRGCIAQRRKRTAVAEEEEGLEVEVEVEVAGSEAEVA